jgi:PAB-dependent poly(A)-specific ribonuclease subunit 2
MASTYRPLPPLPDARGAYLPLTALAFDPVSDTLWAGTGAGAVVARYGARGAQGVAFPVSRADAGAGAMPVSHLAAGDAHVRALGAGGEGVGQWTKGGLNRWFHRCVARCPRPRSRSVRRARG